MEIFFEVKVFKNLNQNLVYYMLVVTLYKNLKF